MAERKLAVVTGASSGIGLQLAIQCARRGYDVIAVSHSGAIFDAAKSIQATNGKATVHAEQIDLARPEGVNELFRRLHGRAVDALLLNAGVGVSGNFATDIPLEDDLNLVALNVTSVVHLAKLLLPQMLARGEGRVLITSSIAALMPGPYYATYAASKAFLLSFSEALHSELKERGVTVTALMPGATDTNFFDRAGMQDTPAGRAEKDDPAQVAEQGFNAMLKGEDHVIAGSLKNKLQGFATRFLTEPQKAEIHKAQVKPTSAA